MCANNLENQQNSNYLKSPCMNYTLQLTYNSHINLKLTRKAKIKINNQKVTEKFDLQTFA